MKKILFLAKNESLLKESPFLCKAFISPKTEIVW
jgi:hypothetical protein